VAQLKPNWQVLGANVNCQLSLVWAVATSVLSD
jgi:hypothetical protein